jgi:hypothetical protein
VQNCLHRYLHSNNTLLLETLKKLYWGRFRTEGFRVILLFIMIPLCLNLRQINVELTELLIAMLLKLLKPHLDRVKLLGSHFIHPMPVLPPFC